MVAAMTPAERFAERRKRRQKPWLATLEPVRPGPVARQPPTAGARPHATVRQAPILPPVRHHKPCGSRARTGRNLTKRGGVPASRQPTCPGWCRHGRPARKDRVALPRLVGAEARRRPLLVARDAADRPGRAVAPGGLGSRPGHRGRGRRGQRRRARLVVAAVGHGRSPPLPVEVNGAYPPLPELFCPSRLLGGYTLEELGPVTVAGRGLDSVTGSRVKRNDPRSGRFGTARARRRASCMWVHNGLMSKYASRTRDGAEPADAGRRWAGKPGFAAGTACRRRRRAAGEHGGSRGRGRASARPRGAAPSRAERPGRPGRRHVRDEGQHLLRSRRGPCCRLAVGPEALRARLGSIRCQPGPRRGRRGGGPGCPMASR